MLTKLKQFLVYAGGLVAGVFCGKWSVKIAGDQMGFLDSFGGPSFLNQHLLIPTNLLGVIEALVTVVVLAVVVEGARKSGLFK